MKKLISLISSLLCIAYSTSMNAQDCTNPSQVCAETVQSGLLSDPNPVVFDCFDAEYTSFFYFSTNTNATNTGNVTVSISNIDCFVGLLSDTLEILVVEVDPAGDPCDVISYSSVSGCASDTLDFSIETDDLNANSDYVILVGTDHDPALSACMFDIAIAGAAVDINACCDQEISLGQSASITAIGGNDMPGYAWTPTSYLDTNIGETVVSIPEETIDYTVFGYVGGCEVTDVVTIVVGPPVGIPNTITPNGDEINDLWKIAGISSFPQAQITIFDRWGQVVFKDIGYATPWDGTNKGKFLPTAAYYYVIELNSLDIEIPPITGSITIIH
jgi:gliding motility-associated-like protein